MVPLKSLLLQKISDSTEFVYQNKVEVLSIIFINQQEKIVFFICVIALSHLIFDTLTLIEYTMLLNFFTIQYY